MAVAGCQLLLMGLGGIERKFGGGGGGVRIDFLKSLTTLVIPHPVRLRGDRVTVNGRPV